MRALFIAIASGMLLAACQSEPDVEEPVMEETVETPEPRTEPAREDRRPAEPRPPVVPRTQGHLEEEGYGLTLIVDGSSTDAFHQSMELIAEESNREQFERLDAAIRYLQVYSPQSWGGQEALYASLDGLTGEEIIAQANELQQQRSRR